MRILDINQFKSLTRLNERPSHNLAPAPKLLRQWLLDNQLTVGQFAPMVCMNRKQLDYYMTGGHRAKSGYIQLHQAFAIEWATQGKVPAWLWLDMPQSVRRIRESHNSWLHDFETRAKGYILKWNSLRTNDGMLREKARALSRLFGVQWSEVKQRAWFDAEIKAKREMADIDHLLRPERPAITKDGVYVPDEDEEDQSLTDEEWFAKHTRG